MVLERYKSRERRRTGRWLVCWRLDIDDREERNIWDGQAGRGESRREYGGGDGTKVLG